MQTWMPHLSLLYHDCAVVSGQELDEVAAMVDGEGVDISGEGKGEMGGWEGGRVVLVETWKAIGEWVVVAERTLE